MTLRNKIAFVGASDTGRVREHNEDAIAFEVDLGLMVLADGMGVTGLAIGVVAAAFVGAAIGRFAERSIPKSILRQIAILLVACAVTYSIGELVGVNV